MGNIGTERREVEFEPLTQPVAPAAPAPAPPGRQPSEPSRSPAYEPDEAPAQS